MAQSKKNAKKSTKKSSTTKKVSVENNTKVDLEKEVKKEKKGTVAKEETKKEKSVNKKTANESKIGFIKKTKQFFHEVKKEVSLVRWPNRKEMVKYSVATITFVLFFSIFFYLIDLIVAAIKMWV